jgi:hypothetical protein
MRSLYARSLAVFFGPRDEDYGYVHSKRCCRTACDYLHGFRRPLNLSSIASPGASSRGAAIADAIDTLWADRARARQMGEAGHARYQALDIRWDHVVARLLEAR